MKTKLHGKVLQFSQARFINMAHFIGALNLVIDMNGVENRHFSLYS